MLYSNVELFAKPVVSDKDEELYEISLGEEGRGRKVMRFSCDKDLKINKGFNPEITVASRHGRAHLTKKKDRAMYILLSSKGGSTIKGDGQIFASVETAENVHVVARGCGTSNPLVKRGKWECVLLRVRKPTNDLLLQVRPSGSAKKYPALLYVLEEEVVYACDIDTMRSAARFAGVEPLCKISKNEDGYLYFSGEWVKL